jgi:hypothetical protein
LKSKKIEPPLINGVSNRFLATLQSGQIENFGSHFQDNPQAVASVGDEKVRWREFTQFREAFSCSKCGGTKFQRPFTLGKPVCQKRDCEAQFAFANVADNSIAT